MAESSPVGNTTEPSEHNTSAQQVSEALVPTTAPATTANNTNNGSGKRTVDDYNFVKVLGEGSYATVII